MVAAGLKYHGMRRGGPVASPRTILAGQLSKQTVRWAQFSMNIAIVCTHWNHETQIQADYQNIWWQMMCVACGYSLQFDDIIKQTRNEYHFSLLRNTREFEASILQHDDNISSHNHISGN